jgi:serine/threonine protein kinase
MSHYHGAAAGTDDPRQGAGRSNAMSDDQSFAGLQLTDRYHVNNVLARGSVATVYDGTDDTLSRRVAIKAVPPAHVATYRHALDATAAFTHPSVLMTIDAVEHAGWLFLVQELVSRGAPLALRLGEGVVVARALEVGAQLCRALAYAHAHGIIHGDVTPTAVLLDGDDTLHLNDFGLPTDAAYRARAARIEAQLAQSLGLPAPAAEETEPSAAEDVRAVGVLLWQMLASPYAIGRAQELRPEVPGKVRQLLSQLIVRGHPERLAEAEPAAVAVEARLREVVVAPPKSAPSTPSAVRIARERPPSPPTEWTDVETQVVNTAWSALPQQISASDLIESDLLGTAPTVSMAPPSTPMSQAQRMAPPSTPLPPPYGPPSTPMRQPVVSHPLRQGSPSVPLGVGQPSGRLHAGIPSTPMRAPNPSAPLRSPNPSAPLRAPNSTGPLRTGVPSGRLSASPSTPLQYRPKAAVQWTDDPALARWATAGRRRARGLFGVSRTGRGASLGLSQVLFLGVLVFVLGFVVMFLLR